jgi:hypothetical protein
MHGRKTLRVGYPRVEARLAGRLESDRYHLCALNGPRRAMVAGVTGITADAIYDSPPCCDYPVAAPIAE